MVAAYWYDVRVVTLIRFRVKPFLFANFPINLFKNRETSFILVCHSDRHIDPPLGQTFPFYKSFI